MLLTPTMRVNSVADIDHDWLQAQGIRALMVDLDDTLVASHATTINEAFCDWLEDLRTASYAVMVLSNGAKKRVDYWSEELKLPAIALAGKPFATAFRRGLQTLESSKDNTLMVGDQLFTDIIGANLFGLRSVLVQPLSPGAMMHTRMARKLEHFILKGQPHGRTLHR